MLAKLKLLPRLVPVPLWGFSGYRLLARKSWGKIRAQVLDDARNRCSICGTAYEKGMLCDEDWEYDDKAGSARLGALRILCCDCNLVCHAGRAGKEAYEPGACPCT